MAITAMATSSSIMEKPGGAASRSLRCAGLIFAPCMPSASLGHGVPRHSSRHLQSDRWKLLRGRPAPQVGTAARAAPTGPIGVATSGVGTGGPGCAIAGGVDVQRSAFRDQRQSLDATDLRGKSVVCGVVGYIE